MLICYVDGIETNMTGSIYIGDDCEIVISYASISNVDKEIIKANGYYVEMCNNSWFQNITD